MNLFKIIFVVLVSSSDIIYGFDLIDVDTLSIEVNNENEDFISSRIKGSRQAEPHSISTKNEEKPLTGDKLVTINCKTARNEEGQCKTFVDCYPILSLRNPKIPGYELDKDISNPAVELERILQSVSGPCDQAIYEAVQSITGGGEVIPKEDYVCCPEEKNATVIKKPTRPPASQPIQKIKCGRVLEVAKTVYDLNSTEEYDRDGRIVNGREAYKGEFPWMVALMNSGRQFCGGSIVDNMHVLTAAHCIQHMNGADVERLKMHFGDHNIYSGSDGAHIVRGASNIYYHRGFSMQTLHNDVAVIRLKSPVSFTKSIQPVCLSTGSPLYDNGNTYADVAGWGKISERGPQSSSLRVVNVRVLSQNQCITSYKGKAPAGITTGMVCAGDSNRDSCQGDSGGPLTIHSKSQAQQIGIVSWGVGCARLPGVYTRVDKYLSWINKNRR